MKKSIDNKVILISNMFAGDYLNHDLAHETINLYKADDNHNYIYVQPSGKVDRAVDCIIFVKRIGGGLVKVLGVATDLKKYDEKMIKNVKYNGVEIEKIVGSDNKPITYEGVVKQPEKDIYLTCKKEYKNVENCTYIETNNLYNQSLRRYFEENKNLQKFVKNFKGIETPKYKAIRVKDIKKEKSLIEIMRKEYDELSFSNMFQYYFLKDKENFIGFLNDVLGIQIKNKNKITYEVKREYKHIDLYIIIDGRHIIIENKIRAGISEGQLEEYKKTIQSETGKKPDCFIIKPDYNPIQAQAGYKVKDYSDIYNYYNKNRIKDDNFEAFLGAIEIHKEESDNHSQERMLELFRERIEENCKI